MRYVFKFLYEREFMILCFENRNNTKYFNSAEHYLDDADNYIDLFLKDGGTQYTYKVPTYDILKDLLGNINIFELNNQEIKNLEKYIVN